MSVSTFYKHTTNSTPDEHIPLVPLLVQCPPIYSDCSGRRSGSPHTVAPLSAPPVPAPPTVVTVCAPHTAAPYLAEQLYKPNDSYSMHRVLPSFSSTSSMASMNTFLPEGPADAILEKRRLCFFPRGQLLLYWTLKSFTVHIRSFIVFLSFFCLVLLMMAPIFFHDIEFGGKIDLVVDMVSQGFYQETPYFEHIGPKEEMKQGKTSISPLSTTTARFLYLLCPMLGLGLGFLFWLLLDLFLSSVEEDNAIGTRRYKTSDARIFDSTGRPKKTKKSTWMVTMTRAGSFLLFVIFTVTLVYTCCPSPFTISYSRHIEASWHDSFVSRSSDLSGEAWIKIKGPANGWIMGTTSLAQSERWVVGIVSILSFCLHVVLQYFTAIYL